MLGGNDAHRYVAQDGKKYGDERRDTFKSRFVTIKLEMSGTSKE